MCIYSLLGSKTINPRQLHKNSQAFAHSNETCWTCEGKDSEKLSIRFIRRHDSPSCGRKKTLHIQSQIAEKVWLGPQKYIYLYKTPFTSEGTVYDWTYSFIKFSPPNPTHSGLTGTRGPNLKFLTVLLFLLIILVPTKLERSNKTSNQTDVESNQTRCSFQPSSNWYNRKSLCESCWLGWLQIKRCDAQNQRNKMCVHTMMFNLRKDTRCLL